VGFLQILAPGADRRADEPDKDAKVVGLCVEKVQHVPQPRLAASLEEGRKCTGDIAFREAAADVTMDFLDHRRPHLAQPGPPVGPGARACKAIVSLVLQHRANVAQAILLVAHQVVGIDCRVAAISWATAYGNACILCRRAILRRASSAPLPGECILNRVQACAAHDRAVALSQGWMGVLLNRSSFNGTVSIRILG